MSHFAGLDLEQDEEVDNSLALLSSFTVGPLVVVGSLATRLHCYRLGLGYDEPFRDIDLVVASPNAIPPPFFDSRAGLLHYHRIPGGRFYYQFVYQGLKVDVFWMMRGEEIEAIQVGANDTLAYVASLESQAVKLAYDCYRIVGGNHIPTNWQYQLELLLPHADDQKLAALWERRYPQEGISFEEGLDQITGAVTTAPYLVSQKEPVSLELPAGCDECVRSGVYADYLRRRIV